jgi:hypothetical protein
MYTSFFCCHKCHKIETYLIFELVKKKLWANLQRIRKRLTQKIGIKLSKIWFGIRDLEKKPIPDPTFRGQKGIGLRIFDPEPQYRLCRSS